jgi:hypothetical protein
MVTCCNSPAQALSKRRCKYNVTVLCLEEPASPHGLGGLTYEKTMWAWQDLRRLVTVGLASVLEGMESDGLPRVLIDQKNSTSTSYWTCASLRRGAGARDKCTCRIRVTRQWTKLLFCTEKGFEQHTCKAVREGPGHGPAVSLPRNYRYTVLEVPIIPHFTLTISL